MVWLHIGFLGIFSATLDYGNTGNEKEKVVAANRNKKYTEFWNFSRIFAVSSGADARCMRPASSFVLLTGILRVYALRFRCLLCTLYGLTTGRCRRPGHCVVYVSTFDTARVYCFKPKILSFFFWIFFFFGHENFSVLLCAECRVPPKYKFAVDANKQKSCSAQLKQIWWPWWILIFLKRKCICCANAVGIPIHLESRFFYLLEI